MESRTVQRPGAFEAVVGAAMRGLARTNTAETGDDVVSRSPTVDHIATISHTPGRIFVTPCDRLGMETEREYFDSIAAYYDAQYDPREMGDVEFYVEEAREADGPVLEAACGTGRIYLEMVDAGVDADGFDLSPAMLERLREKAAERDLAVDVWEADMTEFVVDREYALVTCPFRAFLHLPTVQDQLAAFERFHEALVPGGEVVLNAFQPDLDYVGEQYDEWQQETVQVDGVEHTLETRQTVADEVGLVTRGDWRLRDPDGEVVQESDYRLKLVPHDQFELLGHASEFDDWHVQGGFDGDSLEGWDQEQVWTYEKAP
jgi:ubiquinone/menaquinone biosynthesis C-methylase UbiE